MKLRTIGLRISSLLFGLASLALIARQWAGPAIILGHSSLGSVQTLFCVLGTGALAIWLAKLAGPWESEAKPGPAPKN
jgi:hypothetical protein